MKIKELFEEDAVEVSVKKHPILFVSYNARTNNVFANTSLYDRKKLLIEKLSKMMDVDIQMDLYDTSFDIRIKLKDGNCEELLTKLNRSLSKIVKDEKLFSQVLAEVRYCPKDDNLLFMMKFPVIRIMCFSPSDNCSLIGIHKKIDCQRLYLTGSHNIKRGGLGVLKIKSLEHLDTSWELSADKIRWQGIIKKYLVSRDILACQDELIENGLKDFAKL